MTDDDVSLGMMVQLKRDNWNCERWRSEQNRVGGGGLRKVELTMLVCDEIKFPIAELPDLRDICR